MPFRRYPGQQDETVESLIQLRGQLNGCSDDLTQIHTPGPVEALESDSSMGNMVRIIYIWVFMACFVAYSVYVGIIKHVMHYNNKGA